MFFLLGKRGNLRVLTVRGFADLDLAGSWMT